MEQTNQKEATFNAVMSVLTSKNLTHSNEEGVKGLISSDIKKEIKKVLFEGFRAGKISYTDSLDINDDSELNKYCGSLISNWIKKDKRLNGNVKYSPENPGSRAGQGDETVKELRKLLKQVAGTADETDVKAALDARIAEIKASKVSTAPINVEALPEHLKHLVPTK